MTNNTMPQYFFVLGSNPTLSIAELSAVFGAAKSQIINENIFLIETEKNINAPEIIKNLGGTIKIGAIINQTSQKAGTQELLKLIVKNLPTGAVGKFKFGLSYYGAGKFNLKPLGMELKKHLKNSGISSRWVISKEPVLSSVVVEQNKLTASGREFVLINANDKILIGQTLAVQPFKQLSFRDYGRPARDDYSGMLPPKLAQIMINLTFLPPDKGGQRGVAIPKDDITILDPFCGSGTILTEAMLMGYTNLIGSDISEKAVDDTRQNIDWISSKFKIFSRSGGAMINLKFKIFKTDVLQISKHIAPSSADAIITEPYLGPPRGKFDVNTTIGQLENLYSQSLKEFSKILKPGGRLVMIWPVFKSPLDKGGLGDFSLFKLNPSLNNFKIISPIPEILKKNPVVKLTDRNTIIYGRDQQKVWREVVTMRKI